jgi:beta-glucosidase
MFHFISLFQTSYYPEILNDEATFLLNTLIGCTSLFKRFFSFRIVVAYDFPNFPKFVAKILHVMKQYTLFIAIFFSVALHSCAQTDKQMNSFIDKLMSQMTLEEEIGQLNLPVASTFVAGELKSGEMSPMDQRIAKGEIGGLFGMKGAKLIRIEQQVAVEKSRLHIPLLFGLDVIHGYETTFPIPLALSTSWNTELVERVTRTAASEASSDGISWVFSPMVDICHDARWGRIAEGAGEDPYLGGEIAKAMVRGYQGKNNDFKTEGTVMACVKHYALYGAAEAGRDYNTVEMSRQGIMNGFMRPYQAACEQGAGSYMASFNEFESIPATANKYLLDEVLRKQWGFKGFVVSDYTGISEMVAHGIGDLQTVSARALDAGTDMDMVSEGFLKTLEQSLKEGKITRKQIDQSCRRILEAKYKLGLFSDPYKFCREEKASMELFCDQNRLLSRQTAGECQVLLKNDNHLLPLKKSGKIAVIGPLGDAATDMVGCWSLTAKAGQSVSLFQGIKTALGGNGQVVYAKGSDLVADSLLEVKLNGMMGFVIPGMKPIKVHDRKPEDLLKEALDMAKDADVIIAALGENANMNGEGASRSNPAIPEPQQELLRSLLGTGKPVVLVLFTGRPLILTWEEEHVPAILNAWFPGSEAGSAIADILFGDVNPSGKLTTTFPRNAGQMPIYYNHKNTGRPHGEFEKYARFRSNYLDVINAPLYPFGYGLSYTTFRYGEVSLSASQMPLTGKVTASVTATNTGQQDGKEVVQLYIRDVFSSSTRPVKELKAFRKISLIAGESREVTFVLTAGNLKYYNHDLTYVCEPGDFEIMIGPNSQDVKKVKLTVK